MEHEKVALWVAFSIWAVKEIYNTLKKDNSKNTEAVMQLTLTLMELKTTVQGLLAAVSMIPKIQKDIDEAHARIREDRARRGKNASTTNCD